MKVVNFSILSCICLFTLASFNLNTDKTLSEADRSIFRIELCSFTDAVPVKTVELLRQIEGVYLRNEGNIHHYYTPPYSSIEEVQREISKYRAIGFEEAKEVVEVDNNFISLEEFYRKTTTKNSVVHH
ncbi:MAG: hypothetical protein WDZ35_11290 [Crocinitomicaceae bacterium]